MTLFTRHKPQGPRLDLTPLIDVVFMLLLFFVVTSVFGEPGLDLQLPESSLTEEAVRPDFLVEIDELSKIHVNGIMVVSSELGATLASQGYNPETDPIVLRASGSLSYQELFSFLELLREQGITELRLAYETSLGERQ